MIGGFMNRLKVDNWVWEKGYTKKVVKGLDVNILLLCPPISQIME